MPKSLTKEEVQRICQQAVDLILKEAKDKVRAILLFGSHADGTAIWRSDVDVCVVFKEDLTLREATKFRITIAGQSPDILDIQVFNVLPIKIRKSIADNHQVLFISPDFDDFNFTLANQKLFFEWQRRKASLGV